jgi:YD repeat-containing protein
MKNIHYLKYYLVIIIFIGIFQLKAFSQVSIDHYQGTANINIPLYEISVDGISIPISLSYSTGGIQLSQQASDVGLGWNLNADLSVIRKVNDIADDFYYSLGSSGGDKTGWIHNQWNVLYNQTLPYIQNFDNSDTISVTTSATLKNINTYMDTQPDNFYYYTSSGGGEFIFDEVVDETIEDNPPIRKIGINYDTIIYKMIQDPFLNNQDIIGEFEIVDSRGNKFNYNKLESSRSQIYDIINDPNYANQFANIGSNISGGKERLAKLFADIYNSKYNNRVLNYDGTYTHLGYLTSSWKIGSIESNFGNKIQFTYDDVEAQIDNFIYQLYHNYSYLGERIKKMETQLDQYAPNTHCTEIRKRIKTIETEKIKIVFIYTNTRQDVGTQVINPQQLPKELEKIQVFAKGTNVLLKEFRFVYSYFEALSVPASNIYNNDPSAQKRLKLDRVEISDGTTVLSSYKFNYDYSDTRKLPSRFSNAQDFWGYYNGNTSATSLLPHVYVYSDPSQGEYFTTLEHPSKPFLHVLAYNTRTPNSDYSSIATLNKIIYPTGGSTEFEYEQNTFMLEQDKYNGPGIRVTRIINKSGEATSPSIINKLIYDFKDENTGNMTSSGKITSIPIFGYFDPTGSWGMIGLDYDAHMGGYANSNSLKNDYSDGILGYSKVLVVNGENGEYGSSEMTYENDFMYAESDNYLGIAEPDIYPIKSEDDFTDGKHFNSNVAGSALNFNMRRYPHAPRANYSWKRGFLLSVKVFDNTGIMIHNTTYEPEYFYENGQGPKIIYGLKQATFINNKELIPFPTRLDYLLNITEKYPILTGVGCRVKSSTEINYDPLNFIEQVSTSSFTYNKFNQISTIRTSNSTGDIIENSVKYTSDYTYTGNEVDDMSMALYKMRKYDYMIDYPVESVTSRVIGSDKKVIGGVLTNYKINDGENKKFTATNSLFQVQTSVPISNLASSEIDINGKFTFDQNVFKEREIYDSYNPKGQLVESFIKDGTKVTNIYSFDNITLIASVANAGKNECLYYGFEYGDNPFIGSNGTVVSNPYTGKYSYVSYGSPSSQKTLKIGNDAKNHSGYKASVWVKGSTNAYVSIGVLNVAASFRKTYNISPIDKWHLLEVEMPYDEYKNIITDELTIVVEIYGNGDFFDDLRVLPMDAQMNSNVYNEFLQLSSTLDERNIPTRYTYDSHGRNILIQDHDFNILKKTVYNIKPN